VATTLVHQARAQTIVEVKQPRKARFYWDKSGRALLADFAFRDALDARIRSKLSRGLPTEIVLTALVYTTDSKTPLSTTFQTCRITWHVWEEMYRVDVTRANQPKGRRHWTPSISGVLRRCAESRRLLIADSTQVARDKVVYLTATVRINPIGDELLKKLKRWVSRPSHTTAAAPGSALFSTFTGLFMQRIGDAERTISFATIRSLAK
jgi:hypothetical protein